MVYYYINGELYHHGTKGMKWGRRLYQNKDGSLTPLGRIRYRTNKDFKGQVDKQRALKKAREAKAAKKQHEEDRDRVLKSGTASEVLKYKGELTQQEMDNAFRRLQWEQNVKNIADKDVVTGKSKVDKLMESMGKATDYASTGIKAWNTIANIVNATNTDKLLPKIDTNIASGNRDQYKDHKEKSGKSKKLTDYTKKSLDKMTDDELKSAVERMGKEKVYNNLLKELNENKNPSTTPTKNLIGDLSDLTNQQVKDLLDRLKDEEQVISKLSSRSGGGK